MTDRSCKAGLHFSQHNNYQNPLAYFFLSIKAPSFLFLFFPFPPSDREVYAPAYTVEPVDPTPRGEAGISEVICGQQTVKWGFGSTDVRTQYLLWVEQTWLRLHYWASWYYFKEGRLLLRGDMWIMNCKTMIWFNCGSNPGPSACEADVIAMHYTIEPVDDIPRREDFNREGGWFLGNKV